MKRSSFVVIAWLLVGVSLLFFIWSKQKPASPGQEAPTSHQERSVVRPKSSPAPVESRVEPSRSRTSGSEARRDEVQQGIQSAVITYSPEGVRPIAQYLLDSDAELREAARQGLVQLGEPSAIPLLRDAARRLEGQEASACLEAAAFLELPSWSETDEARAISSELSKPAIEP